MSAYCEHGKRLLTQPAHKCENCGYEEEIQQLKQELERCKEMTIAQPLLDKLINVLGEISEDTDATTAVSIASVRLVRYEQELAKHYGSWREQVKSAENSAKVIARLEAELELYRDVINMIQDMVDRNPDFHHQFAVVNHTALTELQALSKLNSQQGGSDE